MLYFEDFVVGRTFEAGPRSITRDEIVTFARKFDPQPFHLDEEAGRQTHFGGLVASGWHTVSLCMRMMVDGWLSESAALGSPGIDELRWLKPVRPGDTLRLGMRVAEVIPSRSKPDRGLVKTENTASNQHGEVVLTMRGMGFYARRPAA